MPEHFAYGNAIDEALMPPPDRVVRYGSSEPGHPPVWGTPAMFYYAPEGCNPRAIALHHGFDLMLVPMADDLPHNHPLNERYEAGEDAEAIARAWFPKPRPDWRWAGMNDTEDGIVAMYLRKRPEETPHGG